MLKVATLNFTGINFSPFQFHDGTIEKQKLSRSFNKKLIQKFPNHTDKQFIKNGATIDKITKKNRYSALYRDDVGIVRNRLINKFEYELIWDYEYDKNYKKQISKRFENRLIQQIKLFDYLIYESLLTSIFGEQIQQIQQLDPQKYQKQLKALHNKDYLKLPPKIHKIRQYLISNDLDIFFLQQCGINAWNKQLPEGYASNQNHDSLIIYKKSCFNTQQDMIFKDKYKQVLNFNHDSAFIKLGNYLLMSIHLNSKKEHVKQAAVMFQTLQQILNQYKNLVLIIGTDANHYLSGRQSVNIFPTQQKIITTSKIRTYMQFQLNKANKLVKQAKDHIISNMKLQNGLVRTIQNKQTDASLIPSNDHPFDHFVVSCNIILKNNIDLKEIIQTYQQVQFVIKISNQCQVNEKNKNYSTVLSENNSKQNQQLISQTNRSFEKSEILQDPTTLTPFLQLIQKFTSNTQSNRPNKLIFQLKSQGQMSGQSIDLSPIAIKKQLLNEDISSNKNFEALLNPKKIDSQCDIEEQYPLKNQIQDVLKKLSNITKEGLWIEKNVKEVINNQNELQQLKKELQICEGLIKKQIGDICNNSDILKKILHKTHILQIQNKQLKQVIVTCQSLLINQQKQKQIQQRISSKLNQQIKMGKSQKTHKQ